MQKHKDSHLDHDLSPQVVDYIMTRFADKDAFFIETFELPEELGTVPCGLYGPLVGDAPVPDFVPACGVCSPCMFYGAGTLLCHVLRQGAHMERRGEREYKSRVVYKPARPSRQVTVIAGPHDGLPCVLFTAFGGPLTPKEPNDPTLAPDKREESEKFWREHALVQIS
jgi:hypothetical protein